MAGILFTSWTPPRITIRAGPIRVGNIAVTGTGVIGPASGTTARTAAATRGRAVRTTAPYLLQLLLLFGGEDLAEPLADVRIKIVELLTLLVGQAQTVPGKRGKDRGGTGRAGALATGSTRTVACLVRGPLPALFRAPPIGRAAAVGWTPIGNGAIARRTSGGAAIRACPIRTGTAATARSGAIFRSTSWRPVRPAAFRSQFVFRQLAITVLVQFLERLTRGLDLLGGEDAVVVFVEGFQQGTGWRRRGTVAFGPASRPVRRLGRDSGNCENNQSEPDEPAD